MRSYRNHVWDLFDNYFLAINLTNILRNNNQISNSLAVSASLFRIPKIPKVKYDLEVFFRPSILDNVKHWHIFEDDQQVKNSSK